MRGKQDDLDRAELAGLYFLRQVTGIETEEAMRALINYQGKDRWEVWAAESIVWTARRLRARETSLRINPPGDTWETTQATREALRGWGQIRSTAAQTGDTFRLESPIMRRPSKTGWKPSSARLAQLLNDRACTSVPSDGSTPRQFSRTLKGKHQ